MNLKYSDLTGNIIGAAMEVHSYLGTGFQEVIYQRALSYEMEIRGIPHIREFEMNIFYKEKGIGKRRVDFLVYDKISVEIKAVSQLEPVHMTQAINYLEAYNLEVGLLINFGETKLRFHRLENRKLS
jgi:GxxExxY protein